MNALSTAACHDLRNTEAQRTLSFTEKWGWLFLCVTLWSLCLCVFPNHDARQYMTASLLPDAALNSRRGRRSYGWNRCQNQSPSRTCWMSSAGSIGAFRQHLGDQLAQRLLDFVETDLACSEVAHRLRIGQQRLIFAEVYFYRLPAIGRRGALLLIEFQPLASGGSAPRTPRRIRPSPALRAAGCPSAPSGSRPRCC